MAERLSNRVCPALLLILISAVVLFTNLGAPALWDIDEPRNAVCAREMLEAGDWIVPSFNGELRAHKPILLYWLMMTAYTLMGVSEWSARFPSALLSLGTVLTTYYVGRRLLGPRAAFWSGLVLATSLNFVVVSRAATPDATFVFFTTAALSTFALRSLPAASAGADRRWQLPSKGAFTAVYVLNGLAILAKGPVAGVVVLAPIGMFLSLQMMPSAGGAAPVQIDSTTLWAHFASLFHRWRMGLALALRSMHLARGALVAALLVVPWYASVSFLTGGRWLSEFVFTHNLGRFVSTMENHRGPVFYYLIALAIGLFPWSLFLVPALAQTRQGLRQPEKHATYLYLSCWAGVVLLFFTLAATKLPSYIMPAYPALALMMGAALDQMLTQSSQQSIKVARRAAAVLAVSGVGLAIALAIAAAKYLPGEQSLALVGVVPLSGGLMSLLWARRARLDLALRAFAGTAVLSAVAVFGFALLQVDRHQDTAALLRSIRAGTHGTPRLAGFEFFRPSWVFYSGGHVDYLRDLVDVLRFLDSPAETRLITTDAALKKIKRFLPRDVVVVARARRFLSRGHLVVLARQREPAQLSGARRAADALTAPLPARSAAESVRNARRQVQAVDAPR